MDQLLAFFLGSWDLLAGLELNFEGDGFPRDAVHGFIVGASSSFYAQFGELLQAQGLAAGAVRPAPPAWRTRRSHLASLTRW